MDHTGRIAIVTGSGRGLGLEIARRMLADGARVMLTDIVPENLPIALKALGGQTHNLATHHADLGEYNGATGLIAATLEHWGQVDILINNAGGGLIRPFLTHTAETLTETIKRNLLTCLWCTHAALPSMVERGYGRIVNIGADSVRNGLNSHAGYNAAKGGMHGLTTGLSREFATNGITINTIAPPGILTPEIKKMLDPTSAVYKKHSITNIKNLVHMIPMGRFAEMSEVASFVSYVASEEARFVTGQVLSVNGGSTML